MEYIIFGHSKVKWVPGFDWSTVDFYVYKNDGGIFETTEKNIHHKKKFAKKNSPKKFPSQEEVYNELDLVKKKYTWLKWDILLYSSEEEDKPCRLCEMYGMHNH